MKYFEWKIHTKIGYSLYVIQPTDNYTILSDSSKLFIFLKYSGLGNLSVISVSYESII